MPPSSEGIPNLEHFRQVRRRVVEALETGLSVWRKLHQFSANRFPLIQKELTLVCLPGMYNWLLLTNACTAVVTSMIRSLASSSAQP